MKKEEYLKDIANSLALLSKRIEILNSINFYDVNIVAEDFYAEFLNLIFGYELKNLNVVEKNAKAIDLCDEKNKISIQVTSDNSSEKIKETIKKFIEENHYLKYNRLIVLILTKKKKYRTKFNTENTFDFNVEKDVMDYNDLIKSIRDKDTNKLHEIKEFLFLQFDEKISEIKKTQASEVDTIIDLIEYITKNRKFKEKRDAIIDPEYKINKRFKDFAQKIVSEYTTLLTIYGEAIEVVKDTLEIDEAQELITIMYLQDISINQLDNSNNDPISALNELVDYFEDKLSGNGKKYDRAAIKFYLLDEMIKCNVFPNERGEYNDCK